MFLPISWLNGASQQKLYQGYLPAPKNFYHFAISFKFNNRGVSLFGMVNMLFEKSLISK